MVRGRARVEVVGMRVRGEPSSSCGGAREPSGRWVDDRATAALVLAALSWLLCPVALALPALWLAHGAGARGGRLARAAWWVAVANCAVYGLIVAVCAVVLAASFVKP